MPLQYGGSGGMDRDYFAFRSARQKSHILRKRKLNCAQLGRCRKVGNCTDIHVEEVVTWFK